MKKSERRFLILTVCLALVLACAAPAFAASAPTATPATAAARLYDLSAGNGYTLVPKDANGSTITPSTENVDGDEVDETVYAEVEKLELSFTGVAGEQYVVFLLYNAKVPTDGNVRYIDQLDGVAGPMTCTIYPDQMSAEGTYYVYISTFSTYTKVGSFVVTGPAYVLGDVDESGSVDVGDATRLLRYLAELTTENETVNLAAADVDGSGEVDVGDVTKLLRVLAELDTM